MTIVSRPLFQLRSLPIQMRWEVTRRNPYYYAWWKLARAEHRGDPIASPEDVCLRQAAIPILGMVGVSGEPPDPTKSFDQLGENELNHGWLSGAVHPVSHRGLAAILMVALPKDTLRQLGMMFLAAACADPDDGPSKKIEAMGTLTKASHPGLDDYPDEPFVSINPAASERQINQAIDILLKEWKEERELGQRRDRSDKHEEYLEVWDLREGWRGGVYDREAEHPFDEIAKQVGRSVSTVSMQYGRAFELIVGQPFSRELWAATYGPIKLADLGDGILTPFRVRRPLTSPSPRPVPESVLAPQGDDDAGQSVTKRAPAGNDDTGMQQLIADIETLIDRGRTDEEIQAELDLRVESLAAIAYIRRRGDVSALRSVTA